MRVDASSQSEALVELRRARRRRRLAEFDPFEALYRAYLAFILGSIAVWLGSGLVGDRRVGAAGVHDVVAHGSAAVGVAASVMIAVGLRSGGRGGPLALEAADVRHVLMAPIDRGRALRGPALRQARFAALVGMLVGGVGGLLAYRRLPGAAAAWLVSGALFGLALALGALGVAMVCSGRRISRRGADLVALVVVAWSVFDLVAGTITSPFSVLGEVALWPLRWRPLGLLPVVGCAAAVVAGVMWVDGVSIEAAERRSSLVGQLRFAATLRDLRTVMVLRRQLAQELPRGRPWFRLGRPRPGRGWVVWRRDWHGIARFPAARLVRLVVLGGLAGVCALGALRGTTPLIALAGVALLVAALDALEPLSQEIDRPDRRDGLPLDNGRLMVAHLGASTLVTLGVAACGWITAAAVTAATGGPIGSVITGGAVAFIPAGLAAAAAAAISVVQGAPASSSAGNLVLAPEIAGLRALLPVVIPPVVATAGVLPILAARHHGGQAAADIGAFVPLVVVLVVVVAAWVRWREALHHWFRNALRDVERPPVR